MLKIAGPLFKMWVLCVLRIFRSNMTWKSASFCPRLLFWPQISELLGPSKIKCSGPKGQTKRKWEFDDCFKSKNPDAHQLMYLFCSGTLGRNKHQYELGACWWSLGCTNNQCCLVFSGSVSRPEHLWCSRIPRILKLTWTWKNTLSLRMIFGPIGSTSASVRQDFLAEHNLNGSFVLFQDWISVHTFFCHDPWTAQHISKCLRCPQDPWAELNKHKFLFGVRSGSLDREREKKGALFLLRIPCFEQNKVGYLVLAQDPWVS